MATTSAEPVKTPAPAPTQSAGNRVFHAVKPVLMALALLAVAIALVNGLLDSLGHSPQFSFTLAGSFALFLAARPSRREIVVTLLLGLVLRVVYGATFVIQPYFGSVLISFAGFLGIASLMVLTYTAVRGKCFSTFGTAAFFPLVAIIVGFVLPVTSHLSPVTFDAHLLAADGNLGFQPSFLLGRIIHGRPLLWDLTSTVYYALPFAVALLCAAELRRNVSEVSRLLYLFGCMSAVGFSLYAVCPATGPLYAFRDWFPLAHPHLSDLALGAALSVPGAPRNAIPSLHFSTALLVLWNTSHMRNAGRLAAGLFLAGTAFAILALGEHYLVDIVVAVPFSLVFQAAFTNNCHGNSTYKYRAMWIGAGLVAVWLLMLRFWIQPLVAWPAGTCGLFVATAGLSIWAQHKLATVNQLA